MDMEKTQTGVATGPHNAIEVSETCSTNQQDPASENKDDNLIDFDGSNDPSNPLNWSWQYKWMIVMLISLMTLTV